MCLCLAAALVSALAQADTAGAATSGDSDAATTEGGGRPDRTAVGFVTGHGEPALGGQLSGVAEALRGTRTVAEVRLSEGAASLGGIDVVVVAGEPDIPDAELYVLDQFLMRGGRAAFLLDAASIPGASTQANLSESNIFAFLSTYGITVNPDLVLDNACAGGAAWGSINTSSPYPYWPVVRGPGISGAHPAVSGLTSVPMAWTSSITVRQAGSGIVGTSVLLRSSPDSWTVSAFADLDPGLGFEPPAEFDDVHRVAGAEGFPLAVAVDGTFRSAFAGQQVIVQRGREVEFTEPVGMVETSAPTRVVVFAGSMMFRDDLAAQLPGSTELLASVVDWLASADEELTGAGGSAPARAWTPRRLAFVVLALAVLAAAVAAVVGVAPSRRKRPSFRT
ncbi:MAG: Gldg family protein [Candidatus Eisenbacteria bacterium]